jgi:hypothetical protein
MHQLAMTSASGNVSPLEHSGRCLPRPASTWRWASRSSGFRSRAAGRPPNRCWIPTDTRFRRSRKASLMRFQWPQNGLGTAPRREAVAGDQRERKKEEDYRRLMMTPTQRRFPDPRSCTRTGALIKSSSYGLVAAGCGTERRGAAIGAALTAQTALGRPLTEGMSRCCR